MLPTWAHAYSHWMHYKCDKSVKAKLTKAARKTIKLALNGKAFILLEDKLQDVVDDTDLEYTIEEVACFLYNFRRRKKSSFEVTFYKEDSTYVYVNNPAGIEYISYEYTENLEGIETSERYVYEKEDWFDEVFSYPEKEEEPEEIINLDQITNLNWLGRSLICKIKEKFIGDRTMEIFRIKFKNKIVEVTQDDSSWLYDFIIFFDTYELTKDRIQADMITKFNMYDVRTRDLILQIDEFKVFVDKPDVEETKEPEVLYDISDLPENTEGVRCLIADDIEGKAEYKANKAKNNIQVIKSDAEGMFIFSSKDRKNVFVSQILDFDSEFELYEKKFKLQKKPSWKVKDKETVVSSKLPCSSLVEYKQQKAVTPKNWNFRKPFKPDPWQLHSMKFAGEKILLGHRPGFGKTINSILLAERMRNICIKEGRTPPNIYILAPDRKLQKHWIDEVKRMTDIDIDHYIFSTYKHLELSQSKYKYPEKYQIVKSEFQGLNTTTEYRNKDYKKYTGVRCMICDKACSLIDIEKELGGDSKEVIKKLIAVKSEKDVIKHILYKDRNEKRIKKFFWRLEEDKIFFSCGACVGWKFNTGFSTNDIGENNYKDHIKKDGPTINDYLLDEYDVWKDFKNDLVDTFAIDGTVREIKKKLREENPSVEPDQYLSYKYKESNNYHLYRVEPNTIIICDEIHKYVRESTGGISLILQTLWKYILTCRFTILASATPIESSKSELRQLYLLSELLRTKRDYWNDKPVYGNTQFDGEFLPPWDILRPSEKLGDMYDVAARMKNKFSRHNTVANLDAATEDLKLEKQKLDQKFSTLPTKLMNLYMGIINNPEALVERRWIDNGEISNTEAYKMQNSFYNKFTKEALKKLYVLREADGKEKLFPDLEPYKDGYIPVKFDRNRCILKDKPPNSELRYLMIDSDDDKTLYSISVEKKHHLLVKRAQDGYTKNEILDVEQYILENNYGFITISLQKEETKPYLEAGLVTNYTSSSGVRADKKLNIRQFGTIKGRIPSEAEAVPGLKWLDIKPVKQQGTSKENFYKDIPYVPNSLGSKVMKIVITIEDQVRQGKNVMVYHDKVEMLRMIHRALAMRKHKCVNEDLNKAPVKEDKKNKANKEAGDFNLEALREHAQTQALKRWRKLGKIHYRYESEGRNNVVNSNTRYVIEDDKLRLISKLFNIVEGKYEEKTIELTDFEQKDDKVEFQESLLPFEYITEQNKAYGYFDNDEDIKISKVLDYEQLQQAYELFQSSVEDSAYISRHRKYESDFGSENGYNLDICTKLNDFAYYAEHVFEDVEYEKIKEDHKQLRILIEGAKLMEIINKGKVTFQKKKNIQNALITYNEMKLKVLQGESFQSIIYDACKPYYIRAAEIAYTKKKRSVKIFNPKYYHEVYVLKKKFDVKKFKKDYGIPKAKKKDIEEALTNITNLDKENAELTFGDKTFQIDISEIYEMEGDDIKKDWKTKDGLEPPIGEKFITKETNEMIFKIRNKSLREMIKSKFDNINVNENKSLEQIENDNPLDTKVDIDGNEFNRTKIRALDYYVNHTMKKGDFNGPLKYSKTRKKPFTDYVDRKIKNRDKLTMKRDMPIYLLPNYEKFNFEAIDDFIENNPLIYKNEFFNKTELKGKIVVNQEEISNELKSKPFPRKMNDKFKNVMLFAIWTQEYLKHEWDKILIVKDRKASIQGDNFEEYADALIHLQNSPYQKKAKSQAKLYFKEKEIGSGRKDFVDEMTPIITGLSKKDKITFAVMESKLAPANQPKYVQAFSQGYIDCLLVSKTGVVGIDYQSPSPSFMICIDPEKSAGIQDQFNGRTVRRNSHKNLPEKLRKVQYVAFMSDGFEKIEERDDDTKDLKQLEAILKKGNRDEKNILLYRELVRDQWAETEIKNCVKKQDKIRNPIAIEIGNLQELTEEDEKRLGLNIDEEDVPNTVNIEGEYNKIMEEKENEIRKYLESNVDVLNTYVTLQNTINILRLDDKLRWKRLTAEQKSKIKYKYEMPEEVEENALKTDEQDDLVEFTLEDAKAEFYPENPRAMNTTVLREKLIKEQTRFHNMIEEKREDEAKNILNYEWTIENPTIPAGINQIRKLLGCEAHTFSEEKLSDPSKTCDKIEEEEEKEPDNKKWDFYFDNYVNLSKLVVKNNYAFLSYDEYVKNNEENDYDNNYCVACKNEVDLNLNECDKCGFAIKEDGKYLYYHLIKSKSKIQKSVRDKLKEKSKNLRDKEKAVKSRILRDRLEMVLSLNSIEHQVKQYGDTTYKFSFDEDGTKKSFYKRIQREELKEETSDWYEIMTKPNVKIFNKLNAMYKEDEKDRLVDTPKKVQVTEVYRAREVKSVDGFKVAEEVVYDNEGGWFIIRFDGDQVEIEKDGETKTVNISDISQKAEEDNSEEYVPSDNEIEEEYNSDFSIQSEY